MADNALGIIEDGVVACADGLITYAGPAADGPCDARENVDCGGRWITPGLIDCHTHLVHAGSRAQEFRLRKAGATYEEIARAGGGIVATMQATRSASDDELLHQSLPRLDALLSEGVTTVEVKSGYGLDLETELRMLRTARRLGTERSVGIQATFLAAHALPPEFAGNPEGYIDAIVEIMIPAVAGAGLADAVDGFCETIGFSVAQISRVFDAAASYGLPVKLHAEQLSNCHGASLAARYKALSADHLEHLDNAGVAAMARAHTVATLLPGAFYFMQEARVPPIARLREAGVDIALATDCNPGTSPMTSLLLAMNMGSTLFGLTIEECLRATTANAAKALGIQGTVGTLAAGKRCDLAIWDIGEPAELVYRIGFNPLHARVWGGQ